MKRWLSLIAKVGVSFGILAYILFRSDLTTVGSLLVSVAPTTLLLAVALIVTQTAVTAYRWVVIMRSAGVPLALWPALQALFISLALNQCFPSYVGGDAYRVYWLYNEDNPLARCVRGVLIDRVSALTALVAMLAAGMPFLLARYDDPNVQIALGAMLAAGLVGTSAFLFTDALPRSWRRVALFDELAEISMTARRLLFRFPAAAVVGPLALLVHALTALVLYVIARDLALPVGFLDLLVLTPVIMLLTATPISVAGWGVREGVVVGALAVYGVGTEHAMALSILLGFAVLANGLIGVIPLALGWDRFVALRSKIPGTDGKT